MKVADFFNYLFGYTEFEVTGAYPERFITEVMKANTDVWAVRKQDACTLRMKSRVINIKALYAHAKNSGCELREISRRGMPVFLKKYRFRYGIAAGAVIFFAALFVMSSFIWSVSIEGAKSEHDVLEIKEKLAAHGVYEGACILGQDWSKVKAQVMPEIEGYGYITVNIEGTNVVAEVHDRVAKPDIITRFSPCNIVASEPGVIISVRAYNGVTEVKKGDSVTAGQLLVGGIYNSKVLGYRVAHASACIMAQTSESIETFVAYDGGERDFTGRESSGIYVEMFGKRLNLFGMDAPYEEFVCEKRETQMCIGEKYFLPVIFGSVKYRQTALFKDEYDPEGALARAFAKLDEEERVRMAGKDVTDRRTVVTEARNGIYVKYIYTVIKDIAKEQAINELE